MYTHSYEFKVCAYGDAASPYHYTVHCDGLYDGLRKVMQMHDIASNDPAFEPSEILFRAWESGHQWRTLVVDICSFGSNGPNPPIQEDNHE